MPANAFSVGRDVVLDIIDPTLGLQRFPIKTGWKADPEYADLTSVALDGVNRFAHLPKGHKLTLNLDRRDSSVKDYFATIETNYFNGQPLGNVSITETITNVDGSISVFRYLNVALKLTNGGDFKGDGKVDMTIEGMASRMVKVS